MPASHRDPHGHERTLQPWTLFSKPLQMIIIATPVPLQLRHGGSMQPGGLGLSFGLRGPHPRDHLDLPPHFRAQATGSLSSTLITLRPPRPPSRQRIPAPTLVKLSVVHILQCRVIISAIRANQLGRSGSCWRHLQPPNSLIPIPLISRHHYFQILILGIIFFPFVVGVVGIDSLQPRQHPQILLLNHSIFPQTPPVHAFRNICNDLGIHFIFNILWDPNTY